MSYSGVIIGGIDTLRQMGLILLADLKIGTPPLKSNIVEVPGADGTLNMSYIVGGGEPLYGNRDISFSLLKQVDGQSFSETRAKLIALCHGREQTLILPNDKTHYYKGLFNVGDSDGYNNRTIPISIIADPYAYKIELTKVKIFLPESGKTNVYLHNEMRSVIPEFSAKNPFTVSFNSSQYSLPSGISKIPSIKLKEGNNIISLESAAENIITVSYQEARI